MKKLAPRGIVVVVTATLAWAVMATGCVMDASPEASPSTGTKTTEVNGASVQAPNANAINAPSNANGGAGGVTTTSTQQLAPQLNGTIDPVDHSHIDNELSPRQPLVFAPVIEDPNGIVEDGPRPHPWEPAPDPNSKPKIGGAEQSSSTPSTGGK